MDFQQHTTYRRRITTRRTEQNDWKDLYIEMHLSKPNFDELHTKFIFPHFIQKLDKLSI